MREVQSLQHYVSERLPGAVVMRRDTRLSSYGEVEFCLGLRLGGKGVVSDLSIEASGGIAEDQMVKRMVRDLEALGMETFKVAIAERTARLEAELANSKAHAEKIEHLLDQANATIRALTKEA